MSQESIFCQSIVSYNWASPRVSFDFRFITEMRWWSQTTSTSRSPQNQIHIFQSFPSYDAVLLIITIFRVALLIQYLWYCRMANRRRMTHVETPTMWRIWATHCMEPFLSSHCEKETDVGRRDICHKHHKQRLCKFFTTRVKFYFVNVLLVQFTLYYWLLVMLTHLN